MYIPKKFQAIHEAGQALLQAKNQPGHAARVTKTLADVTKPVTKPKGKGGRPRIHANGAARVAAYRARKKAKNAR
jgi:hypothetical protein